MIAAGLLAKKAVEKGLSVPPWVKTSLAPGSKVVSDYLEKAGPAALSREIEISRRRIRMHHLHRQLRPAAGRSFAGDRRKRPGGRLGALRQPQLRGPHQFRGSRQLPDVAAAGRGIRAGRTHRHRSAQGCPRQRQRRQAGLSRRPLADRRARSKRRSRSRFPPTCSAAATARSITATSAGAGCRSPRARPMPGTKLPPTSAARRISTT